MWMWMWMWMWMCMCMSLWVVARLRVLSWLWRWYEFLSAFVLFCFVFATILQQIRYNPIEFNGWKQRHYTLPFTGNRYSLVYFTPHGFWSQVKCERPQNKTKTKQNQSSGLTTSSLSALISIQCQTQWNRKKKKKKNAHEDRGTNDFLSLTV